MHIRKLQEQAETMGQAHMPHFIGGVISAVGSVLGAKTAGKESRKNAQQAQQHSDYQLQNKHQWEVADLRKAGLNPILSAGNYGNSAGSSPMAQAFQPDLGNVVNSAIGVEKLEQEIKNLKATEKQIRADARLKNKQGNVQDNVDRTTDIVAEGADALMRTLGGKGVGANTGSAVNKKAIEFGKKAKKWHDTKSPGAWIARKLHKFRNRKKGN
jgi:hypothetical protein